MIKTMRCVVRFKHTSALFLGCLFKWDRTGYMGYGSSSHCCVLKFNSTQMLSQPQISDRHKHIFTSRNPNNQRETRGLFLDSTSKFREGASADSHLVQDYAHVFVYRIWGRKKNTDQHFSCFRDEMVHPKLSIFTRPQTPYDGVSLVKHKLCREISSLKFFYDNKRLDK